MKQKKFLDAAFQYGECLKYDPENINALVNRGEIFLKHKNYKKAAEFFNADAITELEHAQGIEKYMTDFNILPEISKTETKFTFSKI